MHGFRHADSSSHPAVPVRLRRGLLCVVLLSSLVAGTTSCGNDTKAVTIPPFARPVVDLVVDDTYSLTVNLNQPAPDPLTVSVEVESAYAHAIQLSTAKLSYSRGEQSQTMRVTAKAPTASQYAEVEFTVDGTDAQQVWRVSVSEPAP